jgi:hypothetical protein
MSQRMGLLAGAVIDSSAPSTGLADPVHAGKVMSFAPYVALADGDDAIVTGRAFPADGGTFVMHEYGVDLIDSARRGCGERASARRSRRADTPQEQR